MQNARYIKKQMKKKPLTGSRVHNIYKNPPIESYFLFHGGAAAGWLWLPQHRIAGCASRDAQPVIHWQPKPFATCSRFGRVIHTRMDFDYRFLCATRPRYFVSFCHFRRKFSFERPANS